MQGVTPTAVLVDGDADDCRQLKHRLETIAKSAGVLTRAAARRAGRGGRAWQLAARIAIEETEAWYFGDWHAVRAAYPKVSDAVPRKAKYRNPDAIKGTWEALERELQTRGYFATGLRKVEAARHIGAHIDPARNRSRSFHTFCKAVSEAAARRDARPD